MLRCGVVVAQMKSDSLLSLSPMPSNNDKEQEAKDVLIVEGDRLKVDIPPFPLPIPPPFVTPPPLPPPPSLPPRKKH